MKSYRILLLLGILLGSVISAQAQGLLGVRHMSASGGYTSAELDILGNKISSDSGYGFSLEGSIPLIHERRSDVGLDLALGIGYQRIKKSATIFPIHEKGSLDTLNLQAGLRPYVKLDENFRLFAQAGLGWSRSKLKYTANNLLNGASVSLSPSENGFLWGIGGGLEVVIDSFSIQGSVTYRDGFESTIESSWLFGIGANYWFNESWGLGLNYSHQSADTISADFITGSVRFQF